MTKLITAVAVLLLASTVSAQSVLHPYQGVENYTRTGSCVFASASTACNMMGARNLAKWIRQNRRGGESHWHLHDQLVKWGVDSYYGGSYRRELLDIAHHRGLPAVIAYKKNHSCLWLGWIVDKQGRITHARIWDSNYPKQLEHPTYSQFKSRWYGEVVLIIPRRAK